MSSGGAGSVTRFDRVREIPHYDQVPVGSLWRDPDLPLPPAPLNGTFLATSLDPLPPPPLPEQPAVGPESFYPPSDDEPMEADCDAMDIKPVHRFIPDSVKNFLRGNSGNRGSKGWSIHPPPPPLPAAHSPAPSSSKSANCHTTVGVPCSPPHSAPPSPSLPSSYRDPYGGSGGSYNSEKEQEGLLLGAEALNTASIVPSNQSAMSYQERVEEYHQRYAYMKSWAGLLRILGCVELLLGAAVFACVCAYVHKDNEWFNMYGYSQPQLFGGLGGGASAYGYGGGQYTGPKTPFVLVVAGLAWIVTVILVVLGMSLYYRAILLDSSWWPLTECSINLVLGVLYLAAGVVYVRDTTRGGLCNLPVFNNGINGAFCRTEAGQTAAIVFLFITMVLYFLSAGVCLKLWRHEAARMRKEGLAQEMKTIGSSVPLSVLGPASRASEQTPLPTIQPDILDAPKNSAAASLMVPEPEILRGRIPAGHIPKSVVVADYVAKDPTAISPVMMDNQVVEVVQHYKYPGTVIDNKLCFEPQKNRLQGMVKVCSKIASTPTNDLRDLYKVRSLKKARSIPADPSHPLLGEFMLLPSGHQYNLPRCQTNRKYPSIRSEEERDRYKAVFNDQYSEYKELHAEVQVMAKKFEEMDEMMQSLPSRPSSQMEKERIDSILMEYQRKKSDPTYLEKRERCDYLKNKLSHIKQKIQEYNKFIDGQESS